jgi:predicted small secreted protein
MKNKRFLLVILAMVLVFGMMVIGCPNTTSGGGGKGGGGGNGGSGTDSALNGTWVSVSIIYDDGIKHPYTVNQHTYNNGKVEIFTQWDDNTSEIDMRGNYSTNGNIIKYSNWQYNGANSILLFPECSFQSTKWYSQKEHDSIIKSQFPNYYRYEGTTTYSVSGNTLTLTEDSYESMDGPDTNTIYYTIVYSKK